MKTLELWRPSRNAWRVRVASVARFYRRAGRIRAESSKTRRWPGIWEPREWTTQNLRVVQLDIERGLILVEGAVPGIAGGWIFIRDAVKKALPKDAPKPGQVSLGQR